MKTDSVTVMEGIMDVPAILAYALSCLVLIVESQYISWRYDRLMKQAIEIGIPVDYAPNFRRIQAVGDLIAGIICGTIFALIVPNVALLHCTIIAIIALCASFVISTIHVRTWPNAEDARFRRASQWLDIPWVVLPLPLALWVSAYVVLAMAPR